VIEFRRGNLWDAAKETDVLVNTVNCIGVMGKGIALQFKSRYPAMYDEYVRVCQADALEPGEIHVWENPKPPPKYVFNFATKKEWRQPSQYTWIENGLLDMAARIRLLGVKRVVIPALGCQNGGLEWRLVKQQIQSAHDTFWADRLIVVYEPID
jgi:O-acetyl-ADP-ribose deacetylase (regulator of RNase III)